MNDHWRGLTAQEHGAGATDLPRCLRKEVFKGIGTGIAEALDRDSAAR